MQARLAITGRVQGVGYRDWAMATAQRLGLSGWVRNRADGSVEALVVGDDDAVGRMIEACRRGPTLARVDAVDVEPVDLDVLPSGFTRLPTA
ncbi:MAG: acylphosphatase [Rhodospirillales bacterium 24-66-33]|uniref:acylphosphatase n=1 Tax=Reyranella sp. TaxID=1929291 RepID=UPI000BC4D0C0|nr:acylphosphatase [Reyranella sp.]OYY37679.1 MAG: acylphosphatase [Rhodospirillales bacterium 35-66-84]OYZ92723.1 MAG: acylphosphatase [Rhodospirillales bacterium 24-66-33]OZB24086.1 MAG: acylphosphatase [Rhodospirillales bacterium 39-66-50]